MPRVRGLDPTQEHILCPACKTWREYKHILTHWTRARHKEKYGNLDLAHLPSPKRLFDISRIPETAAQIFHDVDSKHSPEQPQEEDEPLEPVQEDQDYPGAGMREWSQILMSLRPSNNPVYTL